MVSVYQCFDPLKVCVVGRSYPPEFYREIKNVKARSAMERVATETEEDYQTLISKLKEFDVEVLRLDISDNLDDYKNSLGVMNVPPPMTPRDFSAMVGNTFYMPSKNYGKNFDVEDLYKGMMNNKLSFLDRTTRKREKVMAQYFEDLLQPGRPLSQDAALKYFRGRKSESKGITYAWSFLQGIDREEIEKVIIASETNTIGSNNKFPNNRKFYAWNSVKKWLEKNDVPIVYDQYISGAACWRLGKDLFFNYNNVITKLNEDVFLKKWKKLFPNHRVHGVDVPGHSDGVMHPVKEGLIISLSNEKYYKNFYPDWEVVTVGRGSDESQIKPFFDLKSKIKGRWWIEGEEDNEDLINYVHTWLDDWVTFAKETVFDINVLPIDEHNCIVNNFNEKIFDAFDRHGITPHIINFRHRWFWDGGLHCITSDLHREGSMKTFW